MSDSSTQKLIHWLDLQIKAYQAQLSKAKALPSVAEPALSILESWMGIRAQLEYFETDNPQFLLRPDKSASEIAEVYKTYLRNSRETLIALGLPGDPTVPAPDED